MIDPKRKESGTRILPNAVEVTWTERHQILIGVHVCDGCGVDTPPPTMDVMLDWTRDRLLASGTGHTGGTLWPYGDANRDGYNPPGWKRGIEGALWCPECVHAAMAAVDARGVAAEKP